MDPQAAESKIEFEYLEDVAVIGTSGDLRGEPSDKIQSAMKRVLDAGYRLIILDLYERETVDAEAVVDLMQAILSAESIHPEVRVALVQHKGSLETKGELLIDPLPFWMGRWHHTRENALDALRAMQDQRSP